MTDAAILGIGFAVFSILGLGLILTLIEFRKMGNRDQNDSYPRSGFWSAPGRNPK